mmetsp:Transcript_5766/g.9670  ORF Transcript_5766/g.9670 Transcript_5766/m.9670 type:complete len:309 (+) Transcript_5766:146-1072(+)
MGCCLGISNVTDQMDVAERPIRPLTDLQLLKVTSRPATATVSCPVRETDDKSETDDAESSSVDSYSAGGLTPPISRHCFCDRDSSLPRAAANDNDGNEDSELLPPLARIVRNVSWPREFCQRETDDDGESNPVDSNSAGGHTPSRPPIRFSDMDSSLPRAAANGNDHNEHSGLPLHSARMVRNVSWPRELCLDSTDAGRTPSEPDGESNTPATIRSTSTSSHRSRTDSVDSQRRNRSALRRASEETDREVVNPSAAAIRDSVRKSLHKSRAIAERVFGPQEAQWADTHWDGAGGTSIYKRNRRKVNGR